MDTDEIRVKPLREWLARLRDTMAPRRTDADLLEELRSHADLPPHSIDMTRAMDALRDQRGIRVLADFGRDVREGWRALVRHRAFTAVAVGSLALGIGANTAIFSLVNTLMLRKLPVRDPGRLVELLSVYPGDPRMNVFVRKHYEYFRDRNHVIDDLVGFSPRPFQLRPAAGEPESVGGAYVVGRFFPALGLHAAAGRLIGPEDDVAGSADAAVAVVSWPFWDRYYRRDPAVVGQRIEINGVSAAIIGVAPRGFSGMQVGARTDVWVPATLAPLMQPGGRGATGDVPLSVIGWLHPGVTLEQARAEMRVLDRRRIEDMAASSRNPGWLDARLDVEKAGAGQSGLREAYSRPLLALMAIVVLLLLITCSNVASLLLARAVAKERETALRIALGATRWRLVRKALTEALLLSGLGTLAGVVVAYAGVRAIVRIIESARVMGPLGLRIPVAPDTNVLAFTAAAGLGTGLLFGLAPAWNALSGRRTIGKALVVAQVALSLVLLNASTFFIRHLSDLRNLDLGFDRHSVLIVSLNPQGSGLSRAQLTVAYQDLLQRLNAIPGVRSATLSGMTPISGAGGSRLARIEGVDERPEDRRYFSLNIVAPRYFETLGTPFIAGRDFDVLDARRSRVAIVNQALVRQYFPDASPLGRHITFDGDTQPYEIVGVVADAKYGDLHDRAPRTIYMNAFQEGRIASEFSLRTSGSPAAIAAEAMRVVREALKTVRVVKVRTLEDQIDETIVPERLVAALSGTFGALGALLAAMGLYGLLSFTVERRTREIGVRVALGATRRNVMLLVLKGAAVLVSAGLILGIPLALWTGRLATSMVPTAPGIRIVPAVIAIMLTVAVGLAAAYVPARRAARVQPADALRHE